MLRLQLHQGTSRRERSRWSRRRRMQSVPEGRFSSKNVCLRENQNKAADNLRNILAMCRNPTTNKTEYRFFYMGHLGDVDK